MASSLATPAPRYCDFYSMMSYADFTAWAATQDARHGISGHSEAYLEAGK